MGIRKYKGAKNFTTVSNDYLQDRLLSWKAKGLITYIMSLPDDWEINLKDLCNRSKDGRDSTSSALNEIIENNYGFRTQERKEGGLFTGYDYTISDIKVIQPETGFPYTDNPNTDNPNTENPPQVNTNSRKDLKKKRLKEEESKAKKIPTLSEVVSYFKENKQSEDLAKKAFRHYQLGNWHDARGKPVINWKQKMGTNWFKDLEPNKQRSLFDTGTVSNYSLHEEEKTESF